MLRKWFVVVGSCLVLVGCGKLGSQTSRVQKPVPPETVKYLENFKVFNPADKQEAFTLADGKAPFGVFIRKSPTSEGICSATHIRKGLVLTAGHCLQDTATSFEMDPDYYFLVYYDRDGKKKFTRVESYGAIQLKNSKGFHYLEDMMLVYINGTDAENWDSLDAEFQTDLALWDPAKEQKVTYWSFDPTPSQHPALYAAYGMGMKFKKAECTAGRQFPKFWGVTNPGAADETKKRLTLGATSKYHLALENCTSLPVRGNSGGIITLADRADAPVGMFTGISELPKEDKAAFQAFRRLEPSGTEKLLKASDFAFDRMISLAYRFRSSLDGYLRHDAYAHETPDAEAD